MNFPCVIAEGSFGNPAIPEIWDPWLSAPRLLEVWLYRLFNFEFKTILCNMNAIQLDFKTC